MLCCAVDIVIADDSVFLLYTGYINVVLTHIVYIVHLRTHYYHTAILPAFQHEPENATSSPHPGLTGVLYENISLSSP